MIRRGAGSGVWSNAAAAASNAGPIAVSPSELRFVARTAAAKAAALVVSVSRVHPTVIAMGLGSDHSSTSASMPPGTAEITLTRRGFSNARAMPSRCSR